MNAAARLLAKPLSYRLWQAPFADAKFDPVRRHNDLAAVRRVLDVGCGPGTNAHHFASSDYLGLDLNEQYVEYARRRYGREFVVDDATTYTAPDGERFDFVLVNSLLHHIPDPDVERLLDHLSSVLTPDGHIHVLELILPERRSLARVLANMDRGDHALPARRWDALFTRSFVPVTVETYSVPAARYFPTLWNMIYFKGKPR